MSEVTNMPRRTNQAVLWLLAGLLGLVVAFAIVLALTWSQTVNVTAPAQQKALTFGWPLGWVTQDLSSMDPPMPYDMSMGSPWEHPVTNVRWAPLGLDLAAFWVPFLAVVYAVRRSVERPRAVKVEQAA
jgi:hypothetical protein